MRILTVVSGFPSEVTPHQSIFVWRQMQALMAFGHEFHVLRILPRAPAWTQRWRGYRAVPDRYVWEGQPVHVVRAMIPPRHLGLDFTRMQIRPAIESTIASFNPDVIHAHTVIPTGYLAMMWGPPVVLTAHGSDAYAAPYRRRGLRRASQRAIESAAEVVSTSRYVQQHVTALGRERSTVAYNGADETLFFSRDRDAARTRLGIANDRFVILFVGNLLAAKGVFELIDALRRIADLTPLVFVAGSGPCRSALERLLDDRAIEVRLLGLVEQTELPDLYAAADAVALPTHAEGFPCVLAETMLSGRALITTPVGGIPEVVSDGRNGILVPPGDAGALADALRRVHDQPVERMRIEIAAHEDARRQLTWQVNASAYDRIYHRVARQTERPNPRRRSRGER